MTDNEKRGVDAGATVQPKEYMGPVPIETSVGGGPHELKATLLSEASTEQQRQFAKMLAEECAEAETRVKDHRRYFHVPDLVTLEAMKKYAQPPEYDKCPQCGGRLAVFPGSDNMGYWFDVECRWGKKNDGGCGFKVKLPDSDD